MARRTARRATELAAVPEWLRDTPEELEARRLRILKAHQKALGKRVAKPPEKRRRRPSDGQPTGSKVFDYEEYETRLADRKAADPEEWQRQQRAKKEANREFWDNYKFHADLDGANKEMAEELKAWEKHGYTRLHWIWICVVEVDNNDRWRLNPKLSQAERIRMTPRIKGCGAASKRAGF